MSASTTAAAAASSVRGATITMSALVSGGKKRRMSVSLRAAVDTIFQRSGAGRVHGVIAIEAGYHRGRTHQEGLAVAYRTLIVERRGPVGWLIFNRPDAGNAMDAIMFGELEAAWTELDADPDVRVIVNTGEG